jgi:hypothetical protein
MFKEAGTEGTRKTLSANRDGTVPDPENGPFLGTAKDELLNVRIVVGDSLSP